MPDLKTRYLGLELRTPLVVSSIPPCGDVDMLPRMEAAGAGAVILPSLFEEQIIEGESGRAGHLRRGETVLPPALRHIPRMSEYNRGIDGYLMQIYEAKNAVDIPVIASLNGTSIGGWVKFARLLASAGADAIELNVYYLPTSSDTTGVEIEDRFVHLVEEIKSNVAIPLAVKLNPFFSSLPNIVARLADSGADGLVLFNRFYQPDFDLETETISPTLDLSDSSELRSRLRWVAILYGHVDVDLAITGGVHTGTDAVKALMAGANVAMMGSALLSKGIEHLAQVRTDLSEWLDSHGYLAAGDIVGRMSHGNVSAPAALERANYLEVLSSYGKR